MFSDISARAQENFSGARVIRAYAQEERGESAQFEAANNEYINRSLPLVAPDGHALANSGIDAWDWRSCWCSGWAGGKSLLHRITVGDFGAFLTYMIQLTWPVIALGWVINIFQRGTASLNASTKS